jgi:hypothetical protein
METIMIYRDDEDNYVFNGRSEAFAQISDTPPDIIRSGMAWYDTVSQALYISNSDGVSGFNWVQT